MGSRIARRPLICLVTDRRRLCAALSGPPSAWPRLLERQLAGAVAGGVDLIQFRERDLEAGEAVAFLRSAAGRVPGLRAALVVNDRLDVALAAGAAGVHLREESFPTAAVRAVAPVDLLVGRSVHRSSTPESYRGASYVIAGAVFKTQSKRDDTTWLGVDGLRQAVSRADNVPVLAIGGVDLETAAQVRETGAAGVAAIGLFIPGDSGGLEAYVQKRVTDLRLAFDSGARTT